MLTVTVAAAIFTTSAVYNVAPVPGNAAFGTVDHFVRWDGDDPEAVASFVEAADARFGTIEVASASILVPDTSPSPRASPKSEAT